MGNSRRILQLQHLKTPHMYVICTFNRNCEDYNDQKDIYPREHQFPQGLPCADFLRILVTSESEVQGILKALVH